MADLRDVRRSESLVSITDAAALALTLAGVGLLLVSTGRLVPALLGVLAITIVTALATFTAVVGHGRGTAGNVAAVAVAIVAVAALLVSAESRWALLIPAAALIVGGFRTTSPVLRLLAAATCIAGAVLIG